MSPKNTLNTIVSRIYQLPTFMRSKALSTFLGRAVKYAGTSGIIVEELTENNAVISLKNKKPVQNHIGSVHAVASVLIAESATGFLVAMNIPADSVPVIKTIKADYLKRAKGDMRAQAKLSPAQIKMIKTQEKGEVSVPVIVTDAEGKEPIEMEMIWAWTPKKR